MINCVVVGDSWVAQAVATHMGLTAISMKRVLAYPAFDMIPVIVHADTCPNLDMPLRAWEWALRTLAMRGAYAKCHWIQRSLVEVLAGASRQRPYGAAAEVRPLGLAGQVGASLEWGLQGLGHSLAIVRSGLLYDAEPGRLLRWAHDLVRNGLGRAPSEIISPTPVDLFAGAIEKLARSRKEGIYHAACQGQASYAHVIRATATHMQMTTPIVDFVHPHKPTNLSLASTTRLGFWQDVYLDRLRDLTKTS